LIKNCTVLCMPRWTGLLADYPKLIHNAVH
jgi:hypothetical protein